ncbi:DUF3037 domain-containing protein [Alteromonas sp. a30]|uniref:DUF3037 domain-containing protein n=1 Tax=Alteromonas sp. a30 TaxID=2730917 RepID=UPI00227F5BC0|nr:DUF3037 domain-containing protein [Alteromonas sp. a30]MCY7296737.1 DUF3037 domain-containing protein [Alteromonas sp. a30]
MKKATKKAVFHYAVVRFMPFIETREFANIGVVIIEPKTGKFLFKLAPKKFGRVTQFFDDLNGELYKNGIEMFTNELNRVQEYFISHHLFGKDLVTRFQELIRKRESVIHFGEMGITYGEEIVTTLEALYERFVARSFVTKHYREQQMVKVLKEKLSKALPVKFTEKTFNAGIYDIKMPLTCETPNSLNKSSTCIIKPLAFEQQTALRAAEHGETWIKRVDKLIKYELIKPEHALFTLEKPQENTEFTQVYHDIVGEIEHIGVKALSFSELNDVVDFAKSRVKITNPPLTH